VDGQREGLVAATGRLPAAPVEFAARCSGLLGAVGESTEDINATVSRAEALVADVRAAVQG